MAFKTADRVKETTTTTGTGAVTLLGAVAQFKTVASRLSTDDYCLYAIVGQTGTEWEVGLGHLSSSTVLVRDSVGQSSNSDALVSLAAGTKDVWIDFPSSQVNLPESYFFGTGQDGDLTISSGVTTLTRDMFYRNVTISSTATIDANGWRMYVDGVLDLSAAPANAINNNGGNATNGGNGSTFLGGPAGTAGAVAGSANLGDGAIGKVGIAGATQNQGGAAGNVGEAFSPSNGGSGGNSGASGAGGENGGHAGEASTAGGAVSNAHPFYAFDKIMERVQVLIRGGTSGAGAPTGGGPESSSSSGSGGSGGTGGGGGVLWLSARIIKTGGSSVASTISARAGSTGTTGTSFLGTGGDDSSAGGSGGSGGSGGGWIWLAYLIKIGTAVSNFVDASGGAGAAGANGVGTFGIGGDGGNGGNGGTITLLNLGTRTVTQTAGSTGGTGTAHSGATGGAGGTAGSCKVAL